MKLPGRADRSAPSPATTIVLFDGVCNLCSGWVQFLLRRDRRGRFRFATLQSTAGQALVQRFGAAAGELETLVVIEAGEAGGPDRAWVRGDAVLRLIRRLPLPWPLLSIGWLLPRPLRDALYRFVARRRYRWFGKRATCLVPTPELQSRFLDDNDPQKSV